MKGEPTAQTWSWPGSREARQAEEHGEPVSCSGDGKGPRQVAGRQESPAGLEPEEVEGRLWGQGLGRELRG